MLEGGEIAFKSDYISGTGLIPSSNDELPVVLNLDYLHLQDDIDTDTSFLLDPKTISPLVLKIKQFSFTLISLIICVVSLLNSQGIIISLFY